jgi:aspartate kinase
MAIIVQKYGGTSIADAPGIGNVARRIVESFDSGQRVCVVVATPGGMDEHLHRLAREISPAPSQREMDMLLSTGARIACALVAMAVYRLGRPAVSFTGSQAGIVTDTAHGHAEIVEVRARRVRDALDSGQVALVAGFQGVSTADEVTTLDGGSDVSAVALAQALGADWCEIYTDVDGVHTANPSVVASTQRIPELTFDEMIELAAAGAEVMGMRSIVLARRHQIPIRVRSSFVRSGGTQVQAGARVAPDRVCGVAGADVEVVMTLTDLGTGGASQERLYDRLLSAGLSLEYMVREADGALSLLLSQQNVPLAEKAISQMAPSVSCVRDTDSSRVTVVGMHAGQSAEISRCVAATLAELGLPLRLITSAWSSLSFLVPRAEVEVVISRLHNALGLGVPAAPPATPPA